jgi:nuclear transport factor 2 (NTF2) superfamily protein
VTVLTVQDLDAEVAIRQVMVAYMAACDHHDPDAVAALFTDDARWESAGSPGMPVVGRPAIRRAYAADTSRLTFCVHYLTNERITVDGARATARWSYFEPAVNRGTLAVWTAGRYRLELHRVAGVWLFSEFRIASQLAAPYEDGWVPEPKVDLA